MDFQGFPKIARLSREIIITEKIDGTNGQILITPDLQFFVGSKSRWLTPGKGDNHGFAAWAYAQKDELIAGLGEGRHFGEWWGSGIQRKYGLIKGEKRFSLFNTYRWSDDSVRPACCSVVPVLYSGPFNTDAIEDALDFLILHGSQAAPGFPNPEGIVIFHTAANMCFKKTIHGDDVPKSQLEE
jgi:hypothetical protein